MTRTVGACNSLSTTRRTVWAISSRACPLRSSALSRPASRASSASTTLAALARSATTVGRDPGGVHGRLVARRILGLEDGADGGDVVVRLIALACSRSWSMPMSTTPGRSATPGSTSRGMARSMITSGPPGAAPAASALRRPVERDDLPGRAGAGDDHVGRGERGGQVVQAGDRGAAVPTLAATRSACSLVRLATVMLAAPLRAAVAAASALIEPAPTTSTLRPGQRIGAGRRGPTGRRRARPRR